MKEGGSYYLQKLLMRNRYANDVMLTSLALPHEPKYSFLGQVHFLLAKYPMFLLSPSVFLSLLYIFRFIFVTKSTFRCFCGDWIGRLDKLGRYLFATYVIYPIDITQRLDFFPTQILQPRLMFPFLASRISSHPKAY